MIGGGGCGRDLGRADGACCNLAAEHEGPCGRLRGFAAMDRARLSEIASRGGRASQATGTAHRFTSEEAKIAGSKGGKAARRPREVRS